MLKSLRTNMKSIIWGLIIAFVCGTILLYTSDTARQEKHQQSAAIVNGEEIPLAQYYNVYNRYSEFYRQFYKNADSEMMKKLFNIEKMAIDQIIRDALMVQKAKELGVKVSDDEIIEKIKNYPVFQTEGQFDASKWNNIVKNSRADWIAIEENTRKDLYVEKIERILKDGVAVIDDEISDFYAQKNEKIKLGFVLFDPAFFVLKETTQKYYAEHKNEFMQEKQYNARHILVKIEPNSNESDKQKSKEKVEKLYKQIKEGANFLKLAVENSDDPGSKTKGGDLGFFKLGSMVKEFESAVVRLKEGEISQPVLSQFGYHIIKLESIKEEYQKAYNDVERDIKNRVITDREKEMAKNKALAFIAIAKTSEIEKEAKKIGLIYETTTPFTRNSAIPVIGYEQKISQIAFKLKLNDISEPLDANKGIYIIKLVEKISVDSQKYKEDYKQTKEMVKEKKQQKILSDFLDELRNKAKVEILINIDKKDDKPIKNKKA